jgi:hypothetical protein
MDQVRPHHVQRRRMADRASLEENGASAEPENEELLFW